MWVEPGWFTTVVATNQALGLGSLRIINLRCVVTMTFKLELIGLAI